MHRFPRRRGKTVVSKILTGLAAGRKRGQNARRAAQGACGEGLADSAVLTSESEM